MMMPAMMLLILSLVCGEVFLNEGQIAKEVACDGAEYDPEDTADDVERHELGIAHVAGAGDKGGERSDDGDESGDDDGLSAVLF